MEGVEKGGGATNKPTGEEADLLARSTKKVLSEWGSQTETIVPET